MKRHHEFHRVLAAVRPAWVVVENVPGLLSSCGCPDCRPPKEATAEEREDDVAVARWTRPDHRGRDFALLLHGLVELGYGVAWRVLDAQYFGVAQRRRRVFVVGHLGEPWSASASVLFESESCAGDSPPSRAARQDVAGTLGGGSGSRGWAPDTDRMTFVPERARALVSPASGYRSDGESETFIPVVGPLVAHAGKAGMTANGMVDSRQGDPNFGREGQPTYALDAQASSGVLAGAAVRRITPLECERLQGFPDGWTAGQSDSARYRQLGNAVAVPCAAWIGSRINTP